MDGKGCTIAWYNFELSLTQLHRCSACPVPLVVHAKDGRSCHFSVQLQTTASEILSTACDELKMSPSTSDLCEVTAMGGEATVVHCVSSYRNSLAKSCFNKPNVSTADCCLLQWLGIQYVGVGFIM